MNYRLMGLCLLAGAALTGTMLPGAALTGCSLGVEPWERNLLARGDMQIVSNPMEVATDNHIYFSKEAASGGAGFSGGGCGCN